MREELDDLNESLGHARNLYITTSGGFSTMSSDIANKWATIVNGSGNIAISNGATMYHGTYHKYSDTLGSIHITDTANNGVTYVWHIDSKGHELNELATKNSLNNIKTYVGSDGKLHFTDASGADTVLPFNKATGSKSLLEGYNSGEGTYFWIPAGCTEAYVLLHAGSGHSTASINRIYGDPYVSHSVIIHTHISTTNYYVSNVWLVGVKCNRKAGNIFVELNNGSGSTNVPTQQKVTIIYPTQTWS